MILGSFPGEESLEKNQYYANKTNKFWEVMGHCFDFNPEELFYDKKTETLLDYGVGLWDVLKSCERRSSGDFNIQNEQYNNLNRLSEKFPGLDLLIFNGKFLQKNKKGKDFLADLRLNYQFAPSTSGAYPMKLSKKRERWFELLGFYFVKGVVKQEVSLLPFYHPEDEIVLERSNFFNYLKLTYLSKNYTAPEYLHDEDGFQEFDFGEPWTGIMAEFSEKDAVINSLNISPAYRRRGIGTELVKLIKNLSKRLKKTKIIAHSIANNFWNSEQISDLGFRRKGKCELRCEIKKS